MQQHTLHKLYLERLAQSTRPFLARGGSSKRCQQCRLASYLCICHIPTTQQSDAAFLLLMYDDEILKPSNTGRLIADIIPDTFAYIWDRTNPNLEMLKLLDDQQWQPIVVFPEEYCEPSRVSQSVQLANNKRPLFILLDGSWAQAKKMFRKSPYLDEFPVLSFTPATLSQYMVRKASKSNQLATAEVASLVLEHIQEDNNAQLLNLLFSTFKENYLLGKAQQQRPEHSFQDKLESKLQELLKGL